jgi:crossover junction endodeoxyribonuclease RuvC
MFRFGESVGVVLSVCGALQLPVSWVRPGHWKRKAGLIGKDKGAARTLAIQLHPEVADLLTRKKDIGRADAVCIARFGAI